MAGVSRLRAEALEEEENRNALFGRDAGEASSGGNEPSEQQLVNQAVKTHKDTTQVAQRALKVIEQTKQVQTATMAELDEQNRTINTVNSKLSKMNAELSYSERLLRYMRRCCCCFICDSCTGADPETQKKRQWEKSVDKGHTNAKESEYQKKQQEMASRRTTTDDRSKPGTATYNSPRVTAHSVNGGPSAAGSMGGAGEVTSTSPPGPRYRDPDIRLTEEHRHTEMALHDETRKQNELLDQIHAGMDDLLNGAKRIGEELQTQTKALENLEGRTHNTVGRIEDMNNKSQLREFRVKATGEDKAQQGKKK